jgi:hypothetical protein
MPTNSTSAVQMHRYRMLEVLLIDFLVHIFCRLNKPNTIAKSFIFVSINIDLTWFYNVQTLNYGIKFSYHTYLT